MELNLGLIIPFIGTTIGSAMIFLMKNEINRKVEKFLLGFASGVMIAASVWSLLMPSIEMAREQGVIAWLPASVGFIIGILFLLWIDYITDEACMQYFFIYCTEVSIVLSILYTINESLIKFSQFTIDE